MRKLILATCLTFALAPQAQAAEAWGIEGEKLIEFSARVVDIACTLKNDCPPDCGGGKRLLGLLTDDGKLRAAVKASVDFGGAVRDLLPYCGKTIQVDGLLIENPAITMVMVQRMRENSSQEWRKTQTFQTDWEARNGKSDEWYRNDPLANKIIAEDGVYGVKGLEPPKQ